MVRVLIMVIYLVMVNSDFAFAVTKNHVSVFNKDIGIVLGIVVITLLVTMGGLIVELAGQAKVKAYLQIILGASILLTVFGYFVALLSKLYSTANGVF